MKATFLKLEPFFAQSKSLNLIQTCPKFSHEGYSMEISKYYLTIHAPLILVNKFSNKYTNDQSWFIPIKMSVSKYIF